MKCKSQTKPKAPSCDRKYCICVGGHERVRCYVFIRVSSLLSSTGNYSTLYRCDGKLELTFCFYISTSYIVYTVVSPFRVYL